jgi:hypothetical protein
MPTVDELLGDLSDCTCDECRGVGVFADGVSASLAVRSELRP